jgi:hypothetical protein
MCTKLHNYDKKNKYEEKLLKHLLWRYRPKSGENVRTKLHENKQNMTRKLYITLIAALLFIMLPACRNEIIFARKLQYDKLSGALYSVNIVIFQFLKTQEHKHMTNTVTPKCSFPLPWTQDYLTFLPVLPPNKHDFFLRFR